MKVSVIIPAYNAARFIESTVQSALDQTRPPDEIVIVDDGSTDDTAEIVRGLDGPIRFFQQENQGSAVARNLAIERSSGDLLAFLDADDLWLPSKLERQIPPFEADKVDFSFANLIDLFPDGQFAGRPFIVFGESIMKEIPSCDCDVARVFAQALLPLFLLDNHVHTPTVVVTRAAFDKGGRFDPGLRVGQDIDMWFRLLQFCRAAYLDSVVCHRRLHDQNVTHDSLRIDRAQVEILRRWIDRDVAWRDGQYEAFSLRLSRLDYSIGSRLLKRAEREEARFHLRRSLSNRLQPRILALLALTYAPGFAIKAAVSAIGQGTTAE